MPRPRRSVATEQNHVAETNQAAASITTPRRRRRRTVPAAISVDYNEADGPWESFGETTDEVAIQIEDVTANIAEPTVELEDYGWSLLSTGQQQQIENCTEFLFRLYSPAVARDSTVEQRAVNRNVTLLQALIAFEQSLLDQQSDAEFFVARNRILDNHNTHALDEELRQYLVNLRIPYRDETMPGITRENLRQQLIVLFQTKMARWNETAGTLTCGTDEITIRWEDITAVLGPYDMILHFKAYNDGSNRTREDFRPGHADIVHFTIRLLNPSRTSRELASTIHPHVSNGRICPGHGDRGIAERLPKALNSGRIVTAFDFVEALLRGYNRNGEHAGGKIENFSMPSCYECHEIIRDNHPHTCFVCEREFCQNCSVECPDCHRWFCKETCGESDPENARHYICPCHSQRPSCTRCHSPHPELYSPVGSNETLCPRCLADYYREHRVTTPPPSARRRSVAPANSIGSRVTTDTSGPEDLAITEELFADMVREVDEDARRERVMPSVNLNEPINIFEPDVTEEQQIRIINETRDRLNAYIAQQQAVVTSRIVNRNRYRDEQGTWHTI